MCHFLQLPLPTGTQTHSCYSLNHSSEYHNGLSHPVYCITLMSVYTPLLICVLRFVLHISTLSSQLFMQHLRFLFAQREPTVIFAKQMLVLLYAYFLVELYKNIAVEAKHYFQLYHNVSYVLFSGIANHTCSSVVKIILSLM
jgi:hypothetical protein